MLSKLFKSKIKYLKSFSTSASKGDQKAVGNPLSIVVLPFVSLISEKELRLQKLLQGLNRSIMQDISVEILRQVPLDA